MTTEEQVEMYFSLNEQSKAIEKQLKELRPLIELHIATEANTPKLLEPVTIAIGDYVAILSPASRENFNLKEAKTALALDILDPFISTSTYTTLKINRMLK
jgi:hypothetical protein